MNSTLITMKFISQINRPLLIKICWLTINLAAITSFNGQAFSMTFSLEERCDAALNPQCQRMVVAQGPINTQSFAQFKELTKDMPSGTWIALTSPGGDLMNGIQIGSLIRQMRFNTMVTRTENSPADCLSACTYAFLGGLVRNLPINSRLGLHQFRGLNAAISTEDTQKLSTLLARYIDTMGFDRRILDIAQLTTADKVSILTPDQIKQFRVHNLGQSPYPSWRLDSTAQGQLVMLNTFATDHSNISATIALTRIKESIACVVYYKTNNTRAFNQNSHHEITIGAQSFPLAQMTAWEKKADGVQANFAMTPNILQALSFLPEDGYAILKSKTPQTEVITNLYTPNNNSPGVTISINVMGYFGVGGFRNTIQALLNRN